MRILFSRHGESEANIQRVISNRDIPHKLTKAGVSQAFALAETLMDWNVKKIITSPILRALETANIVAETLGLHPTISTALREFDCGLMEGRKDEEAWAAHQGVIHAWDEERDYKRRILPDGESFNDMKARFLPFITVLIAKNKHLSDDILLISHGGMLHQMLPLIFANVDRAFTKRHPLGNCELVVAHPQNTKLVCSSWAGIKLM
jgi:broad specificity phosphatase PhoE